MSRAEKKSISYRKKNIFLLRNFFFAESSFRGSKRRGLKWKNPGQNTQALKETPPLQCGPAPHLKHTQPTSDILAAPCTLTMPATRAGASIGRPHAAVASADVISQSSFARGSPGARRRVSFISPKWPRCTTTAWHTSHETKCTGLRVMPAMLSAVARTALVPHLAGTFPSLSWQQLTTTQSVGVSMMSSTVAEGK